MSSTEDSAATTTLAEFLDLAADHRVVPVTRKVLADSETPLSAYRKLAGDREGTFLLESAENGRSWSRWSFIGARSPSALTVVDGEASWWGEVPTGAPEGGDPIAALAESLRLLATDPFPDMPPLTGGFVGFFAYDMVRRLEWLPETTVDDLGLPDMMMLLATDLAAVDHHEGTITLIANAVNWDGSSERAEEAYHDAVNRLDRMTDALAAPAPSTVSHFDHPDPDYRSQRTLAEYSEIVVDLVGEIEAGEAFQVVPSQRFEMDTDADPIDVYRVLRASNPSPYMYLLRMPGGTGARQTPFTIVGSSPEALVTVKSGVATTHPIAGTRWRGATEEDDQLLAKGLVEDEKENAEHLMLVDLGRNDLGRVCRPGTVKVSDYRHVERYSHVMHLVSTVSGTLRDDQHALDAVTACFPAGTLTGAPKVRAMELIDEHELTRRGIYGGIVGYLDFAGDADTAIAIRTAVMADDKAFVQAGGGVVADSQPEYEYNEARNKAKAVLNAVAAAGTMTRVGSTGAGVDTGADTAAGAATEATAGESSIR
ncbi:anthranilate synthase component I [Gordonia insulae]|uniref:Anthranilate synthase component 1 n=1 Tax=Gordonia insulae TaxID=2420509 RepID=A0A3G8JHQ2_9ACTN|nr:anthranilate synthase component I [Gordonia insulae]AZG43770.1 Anthranilate synthase component 1 [Gordonia insulae]